MMNPALAAHAGYDANCAAMASFFVSETPLPQGIANGFVPNRRRRSNHPVVDANQPPTPREALLAAAARAVLAAMRDPLEHRELSGPATAALRLLESALEPYFPPHK
jgi:hypothetical protein